jgi:hypothetical protein
MSKYTYKQLKEDLNKLTDEQLNQKVLTVEKHDYGFYINEVHDIFDVVNGDPLQFDTNFSEETIVLHIPRKILH